jgi:DNA-binding NarL/FixJ family response regulator
MVSTRRKFYSNEVTQTILDNYRQQRIASHTRKSKPKVELTNREKQIIGLIAQGMTNQEIAEKLILSFRTIETHRANLMRKLEAKNSIELVNKARTFKFID